MSELLSPDTGTIHPATCQDRWRAAVKICDGANGVDDAIDLLRMLGLVERADRGYVPVGNGLEGRSWYPPSPFTQRIPSTVAVLAEG